MRACPCTAARGSERNPLPRLFGTFPVVLLRYKSDFEISYFTFRSNALSESSPSLLQHTQVGKCHFSAPQNHFFLAPMLVEEWVEILQTSLDQSCRNAAHPGSGRPPTTRD